VTACFNAATTFRRVALSRTTLVGMKLSKRLFSRMKRRITLIRMLNSTSPKRMTINRMPQSTVTFSRTMLNRTKLIEMTLNRITFRIMTLRQNVLHYNAAKGHSPEVWH
jgi:hypothetical protein